MHSFLHIAEMTNVFVCWVVQNLNITSQGNVFGEFIQLGQLPFGVSGIELGLRNLSQNLVLISGNKGKTPAAGYMLCYNLRSLQVIKHDYSFCQV